MSFEDGSVVVRYDFLDGEEGVDYELYLFGSHDNFSEPLRHTSGDIGKKIRIGRGKVIYWDAKEELGNFKGDFSLKISGSKYIPFITYNNIHQDLKIKRGSTFDIRWDTSSKTERILIKIQRNGVPISEPVEIENTGTFRWSVPGNLSAGKGYTIQLLDPKNLIREETSDSFSVRRRVPLALKIVPMAALAGASAFLLTGNDNSGIPAPPAPPSDR